MSSETIATQLMAEAKSNHVLLTTLTPKRKTFKEDKIHYPFELVLTGTFRNVMHFLRVVIQQMKTVHIEHINIEPTQGNQSRLDLKIDVVRLKVQLKGHSHVWT